MLRHLDLFSGIGGFALAAQMVGGIKTVQFCEIDKYAQRVLAKNFPNIPIHDDITTLSVPPGNFDLVTGGFPCQDISSANPNGRGLEGERSGLFYELMRVVRQCRPRYIVLENVSALLSKHDGRDMGAVLWALSQSGYDAEWQVISAASVGAPHLRERIFVVAYSQCRGYDWRRTGKASAKSPDGTEKRVGTLNSIEASRLCKVDANSNRKRLETWFCGSSRTQEIRAVERSRLLSGGCEQWATEPGILRVANGIPIELDIIRGLIDEQSCNQESKSKIDFTVWTILRNVWQYQDLAATSPHIYAKRLYDCVPEMPRRDSHEGWNMGQRLKKDKRLRDLWQAFYSKSFKEAQDLQQELLKRIGQAQRRKKMERVDRIRGLGNAIVPQCGAIALQRVLELENAR